MKAILRTDGGARPTNPGHAGFGIVLKLSNGEKIKCSRYIGIHSNNYAEYAGAVVGIKMAIEYGATQLEFISDSKLVVEQVNGNWRVKNSELRPFHSDILKLLKEFEQVEIRWEKRTSNCEADALCTAAIAYGRNKNRFTPESIKEKRGPAYIEDPFENLPSVRP